MNYHDEYSVIYSLLSREIVMNEPLWKKGVKKIGSAGVKRKTPYSEAGFIYYTLTRVLLPEPNNGLTKVIDQKNTPWSAY